MYLLARIIFFEDNSDKVSMWEVVDFRSQQPVEISRRSTESTQNTLNSKPIKFDFYVDNGNR